MERLAANLKVPTQVCWDMFAYKKSGDRSVAMYDLFGSKTSSYSLTHGQYSEGGIRNLVRGKTHRKKDGKPISSFFAKKIWNGLKHLTRDPELLQILEKANGEGNEQVFKALFGRPVCTLTGRHASSYHF